MLAAAALLAAASFFGCEDVHDDYGAGAGLEDEFLWKQRGD
jgi:hypothetical protein